MKRTEVIQKYIDQYHLTKYLEIGTFQGDSFLPLTCKYKTAVDPCFKIGKAKKIKWTFKNISNIRNRYFELTSDEFFEKEIKYIKQLKGFDVIFIDGLHTFHGSLKDALNSLKHLTPEGIIIMHDCYPPDDVAAFPGNSYEEIKSLNLNGWKGEWCGDVWKTVAYLKERYLNDLEINVLNTDYGLGIIRPKNQLGDYTIDQRIFEKINLMPFQYLKENPEIINLQDKSYIHSAL